MKNTIRFFAIMALFFVVSPLFTKAQMGSITLVAGGNARGYGGDGGAATATAVQFSGINAIATDTAGNIYVGDNGRVRKIIRSTGIITTVAGTGTPGFTGDGGPGAVARINAVVQHMATDKYGNCYFIDGGNRRIRRIDDVTGIITTIAGNGGDSTSGDGGPASSASLSSAARGLYVDTAGNIFFGDGTRMRKITASTGAINTIAGAAGRSFSGDGGAASSAGVWPISISGDMAGNIYFIDQDLRTSSALDTQQYRIRKIDLSGNISTVAGNGSRLVDGCPASATRLGGRFGIQANGSASSIFADTAGNIYFVNTSDYYGYGTEYLVNIKKIDVSTGLINNLRSFNTTQSDFSLVPNSTANPYATCVAVDRDGTLLAGCYQNSTGCYSLKRLTGAGSAIKSWSTRDTLLSTPCTIPSKRGFMLYGTVNGTPGATDSVTVEILNGGTGYFDSAKSFKLPYWYAGGTYGFGSLSTPVSSFTYSFPGAYRPKVKVKTLTGYNDEAFWIDSINNCSTFSSSFSTGLMLDSLMSAPCQMPATVRVNYEYRTLSTAPSSDSMYLLFTYDDTTSEVRVVPLNASGDVIYSGTHVYHSAGNHRNDVRAVPSSGLIVFQNSQFVYTSNCGHGWIGLGVHPSHFGSGCSAPDTITYSCDVDFYDSARLNTTAVIHMNYGDGSTDSFVVPVGHDGRGATGSGIASFAHVFTMPGVYNSSATITSGSYSGSLNVNYSTTGGFNPNLVIGTSCSAVSGHFYIDDNSNCTRDGGETTLGYWPYKLVNTSLGDSSYGWCDAAGSYVLNVVNGYNYKLVSLASGYGDAGATLSPSCPVTGTYTFTATSGTTHTNDFAFTCVSPTTMDMGVSGFGIGFIPGDTGMVSIWSSNPWGYMCDTLSSTLTYIKDHRLTYCGMWSGPAPTSISGDTLRWHFVSSSSLFDFTGEVKVRTDTSATIYDTLLNILYVAPTRIADPSMANNTYAWSLPVATSWDPNEKQVSPKGLGPEGYVPNGTSLSYMVHFQNTGTARARSVTVVDTISDNLDISTLQLINSSDSVLVYHLPGNVIKFRFNNINLPDSGTDLSGSNGYVSYSIEPKAHLAQGTRITNTASIYFDYNPPVLTNATINTINDSAGLISGRDTVCVGGTAVLSHRIVGGSWTSSNGHATVSGGVITGISPGLDTITYTLWDHLSTSKVIYVDNGTYAAGALTGSSSVCPGASTTITSSVTGGSWSMRGSLATVSSGVVTGITPGIDSVIYTASNACGTGRVAKAVTILPFTSAGTISGSSSVCEGATTALSASVTGGSWRSRYGFATVSGSGVITGITGGTTDSIFYSVTNTCGVASAVRVVTINPLPAAGSITTASTSVCAGSSVAYSPSVSGGTWSSGSTVVATVSSTGSVYGASAGSTYISYTVTNGCGTRSTSLPVTVNALPVAGAITGPSSVCLTSAISLSNPTGSAGGSWSSSNPSVASIDAYRNVTGVGVGTSTITYTVNTASCGSAYATASIAVNPIPYAGAISGPGAVCRSANITLTDVGGTTGGTWSTSAVSIASVVPSTGVVTGIAAGSATITYTANTATCGSARATASVTVNPLPAAGTITGGTSVCEASAVALTNTTGTAGGNWNSSSPTVASVSSTGVVSGLAAGTATISYTAVTATCGNATTSLSFTVNPLPVAGAISGTASVCPSTATTLTAAASGGTWISTNHHSSHTGGVFTGITAGLDTIGYSVTNGCGTALATSVLTVFANPSVSAITGPASVCSGGSVTLADSVAGGSWSTTSSIASVSATGVLTGAAAGTAVVTYTVTNFCGSVFATHNITINPAVTPAVSVIATPGTSLCVGDYVTLSASPTNGGSAPTYTWRNSGTCIGVGHTLSYTPANGDAITCEMVSNASCITTSTVTSAVTTLDVSPILTPSIAIAASNDTVRSAGQVINFTAAVIGGGTAPAFQWIVGGGAVAGATNASYSTTFTSSKTVYCSLVSSSPCVTTHTANSNMLTIIMGDLSIAQVANSKADIAIFPNPNNGAFVIDLPAHESDVALTIIDVNGKTVKSMTITDNKQLQVPVELNNIAAGVYMLRAQVDGTVYYRKVVFNGSIAE